MGVIHIDVDEKTYKEYKEHIKSKGLILKTINAKIFDEAMKQTMEE